MIEVIDPPKAEVVRVYYGMDDDGWHTWCVQLPTGIAVAGSRKSEKAARKDAEDVLKAWESGEWQ